MCDEFIKSYSILKKDITLSDEDKKYIEQAKVNIITKEPSYRDEYYKWKQYDLIIFYRNYDNIYDTLQTGRYKAPVLKVGKRKLNKEIHVFGLPEHCYK